MTLPFAVKVTRRMTFPSTLSCRASLVYCTGGFDSTSRFVAVGTALIGAGATAVAIVAGIPAAATLPLYPVGDVPVPPGMPADATRPTVPAFEPDFNPLPIPVDPTTPCGATDGPCIPP